MTGQRVIFLGASNLKRTFPVAVRVMQQHLAHPLAFHVAMGHGRSYGHEAGSLGKKFFGIFSSSIWRSVESDRACETLAFITDVGNDLGYGIDVEKVSTWVGGCVARLQEMGARIVLTGLPLESLGGVSAARFRFFRALFFPFSQLDRDLLLRRAAALQERLEELARYQKIPIFSAPNSWYGLDPIHFQSRYAQEFWRGQLGAALDRAVDSRPLPADPLLNLYLRLLSSPTSTRELVRGLDQGQKVMLHDGTSLTLH